MRVLPYFVLLRPPLLVLGLVAPLGLLRWSGKLGTLEGLLILLTIFLSNAGFNVLNELRDVEVDRRKKPSKPLPSGRVSLRSAKMLTSALLASSLPPAVLLSILSPRYAPMIVLGYTSGMIYNATRKDLVGNFFMGLAYGTASLMCLHPMPEATIFSLAFALFVVGHNVMNQVQDLEAERGLVVTVPMQIGVRGSLWLSRALSFAALLLYSAILVATFKPSLGLMCSPPLCVITSTVRTDEKTIERLVRIAGRAFLLVAFLAMAFGS
jgi:geranylgeranylglycerol-phosphate geranylgeranyltransferase